MASRSTTEAVTLMNEMYAVFEKLLAKYEVGVTCTSWHACAQRCSPSFIKLPWRCEELLEA